MGVSDMFSITFSDIFDNELEKIKAKIAQGCNINRTKNFEFTPLVLSCSLKKLEMVKVLLEAGADVNEKNANDSTALMFAAREGVLDIVKLLLAHGAQLEDENENGWTVLHFAIANAEQMENTDLLKCLISKGASVNHINRFRQTCLLFAVENLSEGFIKNEIVSLLLLQEGIDINVLFSSDCILREALCLDCFKEYVEQHFDQLPVENQRKWKAKRMKLIFK